MDCVSDMTNRKNSNKNKGKKLKTPNKSDTDTKTNYKRVVPKGIIDGFEVPEETLDHMDWMERIVADWLIREGWWILKKKGSE